DEDNEVAPERWAHISAKPSEYVKSGRVFFSCEPGDEFIPFFIDHVGEDAMLFASDYLHFDALFVGEPGHDGQPYPGTVATLLGRKDVPDSAKRKMLLDNSLNFYLMDQSKLGRRGMPVARPEPAEARLATMPGTVSARSEEHTSELQSRGHLVCRLLLEKKKHDRLAKEGVRAKALRAS